LTDVPASGHLPVMAKISGSDIRPGIAIEHVRVPAPPFIGTGQKIVISTDDVAYGKRAD
jgi:hypothetical protein